MSTQHYWSVGIDWSTWSKPRCIQDLDEVLKDVFTTFGTQREKAWGGHGYSGMDLAVYGKCCSRGNDVLVDLPARAMEHLRNSGKFWDESICDWFLKRGFRCKRLDVAVDTAEPKFNPMVALTTWHRGLARCSAQQWDFRLSKIEIGKPLFPKDGKGMTTYIGSESGQRRARIYDKVAEAINKTGEIVTDHHGNELKHLTRIELQHRDAAAHMAAQKIVAHGLRMIPELINGYVTFLSVRDSRKKRRKNAAAWWTRIVGPQKEMLELTKGTATPDDSICWIKSQVAPTLKLLRSKAPDVWKHILDDVLFDIQIPDLVEKRWDTWSEDRAKRKAEQKELEQIERDDSVVARVMKAHAEAARTEAV